MKLAIVGSREFNNYELLCKTLEKYENISMIISGGAIGADKLGEKFAQNNNIEIKIFYPNWNTHGKKAGILRNKIIVENADEVIAFWNGESKGTLSTINFAKQLNKKCVVINI